jgi:hypothetical protein
VASVGVASAAGGQGNGHHDRVSHAPVAARGVHGAEARAGFQQHAPTNLGRLQKPAPGPAVRAVSRQAGSSVLAAAGAGTSSWHTLGVEAVAVIPPPPVITSSPTNPSVARSATFTFTDGDPTATFECKLDNGRWATCSSPTVYAGPLSFANHTFRVRARNTDGTSGTTTFTWRIVAVLPPTLTGQPLNPTTERSAAFAFTTLPATATFQCRLDGSSFSNCISPKVYPGPIAYGSHTFRVRAVSGSTTSAATLYTWSVVPPAPAITSQPSNPSTSTTATFTFTSTGTGLSFQCSLDGVAFAACTSPKTYTALAVGSHTFRVRAVGNNVPSQPTEYTWSITSPAPPQPTITQQPDNPSSATSATFAFTDTDPTATFECSLDNSAFTACTSPKQFTDLGNGSHTFQVRATTTGGTSSPASYTWTIAALRLKTKLLVISADGDEEFDFASNPNCSPSPCKGAIQTYLDQVGVPYDTLIASTDVSSAAQLTSILQSADGTTGNYYGIILATGNLIKHDGTFASAFDADEWNALWAYEAAFHVRQVTSFTAPFAGPLDYGLDLVGETGNTIQASLTDAGKQVFSDLNPSATITLANTYTYLANPRDASVTPLVTDGSGHAIVSTDSFADGRENLAVTTGNAPWLFHTKLLSYGIVNWLTRGVFLGSRQVTMNVEVDDLLIDSNMWDTVNNTDHDADPQNGTQYRLDATDWQNIIDWQNGVRASSPLLSGFTLEWAFNGEGAFGDPPSCEPIYPNNELNPPITEDTLTPAIKANSGDFNYVTHTYDHQNVDLTSYETSAQQIQWNQAAASAAGLGGTCPPGLNLGSRFDPTGFVQPDISGLTNSTFLQAAYDNGVRSLITDTSQPAWNNPSPNAGFKLGPGGGILALPRHPTNLFYSLRTPAEWVDEYNWFYWLGSPSSSPFKIWPDEQTFAQIVDHESDNLLGYLLNWDSDPWMFHQANLGRYDGENFLLADLLDAMFAKYLAVYKLPIVNMSQPEVRQVMSDRMAYDASGAEGTLVPCQSLTVTVQAAAQVPITGLSAGTTETYGGQPISRVQVSPGSPVTIPVSC